WRDVRQLRPRGAAVRRAGACLLARDPLAAGGGARRGRPAVPAVRAGHLPLLAGHLDAPRPGARPGRLTAPGRAGLASPCSGGSGSTIAPTPGSVPGESVLARAEPLR